MHNASHFLPFLPGLLRLRFCFAVLFFAVPAQLAAQQPYKNC